MLGFNVTGLQLAISDFRKVNAQLDQITARALNSTVALLRHDEQREMMARFNNPVPWLVRQVRYKKAYSGRLVAAVGSPSSLFGSKQGTLDRVLEAHIFGGKREAKQIEFEEGRLFALSGQIFTVPRNVKLNQYGNVPRVRWRSIIKKASAKQGGFFATNKSTGKVKAGIYQRIGKGKRAKIKMVLGFKTKANYKRVLRWVKVAETTVNRNFLRLLDVEVKKVLQR